MVSQSLYQLIIIICFVLFKDERQKGNKLFRGLFLGDHYPPPNPKLFLIKIENKGVGVFLTPKGLEIEKTKSIWPQKLSNG